MDLYPTLLDNVCIALVFRVSSVSTSNTHQRWDCQPLSNRVRHRTIYVNENVVELDESCQVKGATSVRGRAWAMSEDGGSFVSGLARLSPKKQNVQRSVCLLASAVEDACLTSSARSGFRQTKFDFFLVLHPLVIIVAVDDAALFVSQLHKSSPLVFFILF